MLNASVFVDTNIVLYSRSLAGDTKQRIASEWMRRLWVEQRGRTSMQVLNEFYWNATHKLRLQVDVAQAWQSVEMLMGWNPQSVSVELMQQARAVESRWQLSWGDSLIVAAAQLQGCALLLTEDLENGAIFGKVRAVNPFVSEVHADPATYAVKPVSRHRPRGRPRKQPAA
jgi:predicted nucleic acid-binding protein